jgi:hypothetical protein
LVSINWRVFNLGQKSVILSELPLRRHEKERVQGTRISHYAERVMRAAALFLKEFLPVDGYSNCPRSIARRTSKEL